MKKYVIAVDFYYRWLDHLVSDTKPNLGLLRCELAREMGCGCLLQGFATFSHSGPKRTWERHDQDLAAAGVGPVV